MIPTGQRPPRWAQAELREPEVDEHDERACLALEICFGAIGAGVFVFGLIALLSWARGLV